MNKFFYAFVIILIIISCNNTKPKIVKNSVDFFGDNIFVSYKNSIILIENDKIYKKDLFLDNYFIHNDKLFLIEGENIFNLEIKENELIFNKIYNANDIYVYKDKTFLLKKNKIIINKDLYSKKIYINKKYESFKVIEDTFIFKSENNLYIKRLINGNFKDIKTIEYVKKFLCMDYSIIYVDFENNIKKYDITINKEELIDTVPFVIYNFKIFDNILLIYGENVLELLYLDSKKIEIGKVELLDASLSIKDNSIIILTHNKITILDLTDKKIKKEITLVNIPN